MRLRAALAASTALAIAVYGLVGAAAQDMSGDPYYGSVSLDAGFLPDPYSTHIGAGGNNDASALGSGCVGMIGGPPDYNLNFTSNGSVLYVSAASDGDVSLVVNAPDGAWYCDDDSGTGLNAGLTFAKAQSGLYNIWVGRFGDTELVDATLHISEYGYQDGLVDETSNAASAINPAGAPTYGSVELLAGFLPDPHAVSVVPGGPHAASDVSSSCAGRVAADPDFDLHYTAGSGPLHISANSSVDTTLLINLPNGEWVCDDDSGEGLNPAITFDTPQSGLYDIWVGQFGEASGDATLNISEVSIGAGTEIDPGAAPTYGNVELTGGFVPDPHTVSVISGGPHSAANVHVGCAGTVAAAPDFDLYFTGGSSPLYISAGSATDTTLLINTPSGAWVCDDDSGEGLNPGITFETPEDGLYDIWVGSFGGASGDATLNISEVGFYGVNGDSEVNATLDISGDPYFGSANLTEGFIPDPHTVSLTPGGNVNASSAAIGCAGRIGSSPDFNLVYTAGRSPLYISTSASLDTTLVVNAPDGSWICDDDSGAGLNAGITLKSPQSGLYNIWVGRFGGVEGEATLHISELGYAD